MNENRFLKNLSQQSSPNQAVEPIPSQPVRRNDTAPTEHDSIKRLADELSRHSGAIEGLNTRIDRMEGRPQAATQTEVQALLHEAQEGVNYTMDSGEVAGFLLLKLTKGMPSAAEIRAAADAGASMITAAGNAAAAQIERAGSEAAERIRWASQSKADVFAGRIGFTSWKAASGVFLGFLLLLVFSYWQSERQAEKIVQAQLQTQAVRDFTNWAKAQPEGKRLYERYYNP